VVGKYKPGETVEQWRAEGYCHDLALYELIDHVAHRTITEMIASVRASKEMGMKCTEEILQERSSKVRAIKWRMYICSALDITQ